MHRLRNKCGYMEAVLFDIHLELPFFLLHFLEFRQQYQLNTSTMTQTGTSHLCIIKTRTHSPY